MDPIDDTKSKVSSDEKKLRISKFSTIEFRTHLPDTNPEGAIDDITQVLSYLGFFDDMSP